MSMKFGMRIICKSIFFNLDRQKLWNENNWMWMMMECEQYGKEESKKFGNSKEKRAKRDEEMMVDAPNNNRMNEMRERRVERETEEKGG